MPRLNEYISVGFCAGYGDGDYRVSMAVGEMSRERFNELKLATLAALHCAEDMWRRARPAEQASQALPTPSPQETDNAV